VPFVIRAGLAEMVAGGVSMFLGGYTAARATREAYHYQVGIEREEIRYEPDEERAEVTQIYRNKGFREPLLDDIVHHVTSDPERWLNVMVRDELGAPPDEQSPSWQVGLAVGLSFMLGALVPLLPFIAHAGYAQALAIASSIMALVLTGAARSRYSRKTWWASAGEMVAIGVAGSAAGLVIGRGLNAIGQ
jgi:vacuolar iron transporter family protein